MKEIKNNESDAEYEAKIRPTELASFSGQSKIVENLQVFPGTQTLQELEFTPLPEQTPFPSRTEVVHTTPQNL